MKCSLPPAKEEGEVSMNAQHEHERPIGDPPDEDDRDDEDEDDFENEKKPEDQEEDCCAMITARRIRSQGAIEIGTARQIAEAWKQPAIARGLEEIAVDSRYLGPCRTWNFRWYRVGRRWIR